MINWIKKNIPLRKKRAVPLKLKIQQAIIDARDNLPSLNNSVAQILATEKIRFNEIKNILERRNIDVETLFKENNNLADAWKLIYTQSSFFLLLREEYVSQLTELNEEGMNAISTIPHSEHLAARLEQDFDTKLAGKIFKIEPDLEKLKKSLSSAIDAMIFNDDQQPLKKFFARFRVSEEKYQPLIKIAAITPGNLFNAEAKRRQQEEEKWQEAEAKKREEVEKERQNQEEEEKRKQEQVEKNKKEEERKNVNENLSEKSTTNELPESFTAFQKDEADFVGRNLVFISYSRKDKRWLDKLKVHLKPFERNNIIKRWDDTEIEPGEEWKTAIKKAIKETKVAVLLISEDFLASDFINDDELPPLLEAAEKEGAKIISLIIKHCTFTGHDQLSHYQSFNDPRKPLATLSPAKQGEVLANLTNFIVNKVKN